MGEKKNSLKVTQKQYRKREDKYGVRNEGGTTKETEIFNCFIICTQIQPIIFYLRNGQRMAKFHKKRNCENPPNP